MSAKSDDNWLPALEAHLGLTDPVPGADADRPDPATLGWVRRLLPLYSRLPEAELDMQVWHRINRSLGPVPAAPVRAGRAWQFATAGFAALAASLAFILLFRSPPPAKPLPPTIQIVQPLTAPLVATGGATGRPVFVVATTPGGAAVRSNPGSARPVVGHSYHLWAVTSAGHIYLGAISPKISHSVHITDASRRALAAGAVLIVSLDAGDTPPPRPGNVVAHGKLVTL